MSSSRILIADCTPAAMQTELGRFGGSSNPELFESALLLHQPDIRCVSANIADGEALPHGLVIDSFDGVVLTGAPYHVYDTTPVVPARSSLPEPPLPPDGRYGEAAGVCNSTRSHWAALCDATLTGVRSE
jgi:hypothetical protein